MKEKTKFKKPKFEIKIIATQLRPMYENFQEVKRAKAELRDCALAEEMNKIKVEYAQRINKSEKIHQLPIGFLTPDKSIIDNLDKVIEWFEQEKENKIIEKIEKKMELIKDPKGKRSYFTILQKDWETLKKRR